MLIWIYQLDFTLNCQKYARKPLSLFELKPCFSNLFLTHINFLIHFYCICRSYRTCNGIHPHNAQPDHSERTVSLSTYNILNYGLQFFVFSIYFICLFSVSLAGDNNGPSKYTLIISGQCLFCGISNWFNKKKELRSYTNSFFISHLGW